MIYDHYRSSLLKEWAVEYKGGSCQLCGYNKCLSALEFHHLEPTTKKFNISGSYKRSRKAVRAELDKCILLCSNCHREVEEGFHEEWIANLIKHSSVVE